MYLKFNIIGLKLVVIKFFFNFFFKVANSLNREDDRRRTFVNWTNSNIDPEVLARAGFYYHGPMDSVCCWFCKVIIGRW